MITILTGDALEQLRTLPDASVHCCVTSPPYYGLRDYGMAGQIGLEDTPDTFVGRLVEVFREVRRVLREDGTCWLNIGDSYAGGGRGGGAEDSKQQTNVGSLLPPKKPPTGTKAKDLIGVPWMLAFALRADGWYLRQDIIWHKPNPMPESVTDRCTKSHEYVFLLSKSSRYYYDADAVAEPLGLASIARLSQDTASQSGSNRVPGKTNGTMKAVGRRAAGNKTHKGQTAYEEGEERFRTKAGLVGFAERERAKVDAGDLEGSRNKRSVWTIATQPYSEAHFATMAPELAETCVRAGCPVGGTVIDPFGGAGTTGLVADRLGRNAILIELNPAYVEIARKRLSDDAGMFAEVAA